MGIIQKHPTFYIEILPDEIIIYTKHITSSYPSWLGKNKSSIRKATVFLLNHPPQTILECMEFVSKFELYGGRSSRTPNPDYFVYEKSIDKTKIFW